MPGWNVGAKCLRDTALSWKISRKINGRPRAVHIAEMHRISRARYHRSIRHIQRNKKIIQSEKIVRYQAMLMVLVTVKTSLSCFLKSIKIDITLYHIILMIYMLLKVQYSNDYNP